MWKMSSENSNKFQKTRFWKEKSVEDVVTLEPTAQATLVCFGRKQLEPRVNWQLTAGSGPG
jgi:hypothetical protein